MYTGSFIFKLFFRIEEVIKYDVRTALLIFYILTIPN